MHLLVEKTVSIHRPVQAVFGYISNMEQFGEWFPGVIAIKSLGALAHGQPGKEYLETVVVPLRGRRQVTLQVREARAPGSLPPRGGCCRCCRAWRSRCMPRRRSPANSPGACSAEAAALPSAACCSRWPGGSCGNGQAGAWRL